MYFSTKCFCFVVVFTFATARIAVNNEDITAVAADKGAIVQKTDQSDLQINEVTSNSDIDNSIDSTTEHNNVTETVNEKNNESQNVKETEVHVKQEESNNTKTIIDNVIDPNDKGTIIEKITKKPALILTPFIEADLTKEARLASKVDSALFLQVKSYSGFLTVNKTHNSNTFFWYFPIPQKEVSSAPWIIWLQGGPGASSMTGLFDENGPFHVNAQGQLVSNPYSWLSDHSLLYIDNPVGTGFSFTDSPAGLVHDMETYTKHLYSAVEQFIKIFPELKTAPLYLAGESYAGKYVPALAMEIHRNKDEMGINLTGLIMGNAFIDPTMASNLLNAFYQFGSLSIEEVTMLQPMVKAFNDDLVANRSTSAKQKWNNLIAILLEMTNQPHIYNFLSDDFNFGGYLPFLNRTDVRQALHVGDTPFNFINYKVNVELAPDFLSNAGPMVESLLEHYKVLAYCGQLDQMVPCVSSSEKFRTWKWSRSEEFQKAPRLPFFYNKKLAGYHKTGGRFTEALIRGAGHSVPIDTPGSCQDLITKWTHDKPLFKITFRYQVQQYLVKGLLNMSRTFPPNILENPQGSFAVVN